MLVLDKETHTYYYDDKETPSVTQVLPGNIFFNGHEDKRDLGTAGHRMAYLHNIGFSDNEIYLDDELIYWFENYNLDGYFDAFKKFRKECPYVKGVVDYKTGSPDVCTPWQLAGYHELAKINEIEYPAYEIELYNSIYRFAGTIDEVSGLYQVYALYLKDTGNYSLVDHSKDLRKNTQIFLSFVTTYIVKKENNLL
jgi:hypothetical protein